MAYKSGNDTSVVLGSFAKNKRGDLIQVQAITDDSSNVSYDIRNMFTNDADEVCYTSKGVRIRKDIAVEVIAAILNHMDPETYNDVMSRIDMSDEASASEDNTETEE